MPASPGAPIRYACVTCGKTFESAGVVYRCPDCARRPEDAHGFPTGCLSVVYAPPGGKRMDKGGAADIESFLPLPMSRRSAFPAGATPLIAPEALRKRTGFANLWLKNDAASLSGSLKDRASALVAEQALAAGEDRVVLASTGNAGASMACAGAACGLRVILFVPAAAPRAKLLQSLLYGARVVPVQGTYDEAFSLSIAYTERFGGINRNTAYNPLTVEGKKTVSLEIYNQLGCRVPDSVYVPTGDGVIFSGACKGFADLKTAGLADRVPEMNVVQAEGSNAIVQSARSGRQTVIASARTIADSLSVRRPAAGSMALRFLSETGGRAVQVTDVAIQAAQAELAHSAGLFVEPSSAAAWAGFLQDRQNLDPRSTVVVLLTGTGFKDVAAAESLVSLPPSCPSELESATRFLSEHYHIQQG
ncbi:MAG TPA: pyridoxal-phosphate dependent enzyme [Spirochaetia bacterium]|nr:pyridoxal-phosphate dependent enzyme [Spirochaetia bacterium]